MKIVSIVINAGTIEKTVKSEQEGIRYLQSVRKNGIWVVSYKIEGV